MRICTIEIVNGVVDGGIGVDECVIIVLIECRGQ